MFGACARVATNLRTYIYECICVSKYLCANVYICVCARLGIREMGAQTCIYLHIFPALMYILRLTRIYAHIHVYIIYFYPQPFVHVCTIYLVCINARRARVHMRASIYIFHCGVGIMKFNPCPRRARVRCIFQYQHPILGIYVCTY